MLRIGQQQMYIKAYELAKNSSVALLFTEQTDRWRLSKILVKICNMWNRKQIKVINVYKLKLVWTVMFFKISAWFELVF